MSLRRSAVLLSLLVVGAAVALSARRAPAPTPSLFSEMRWRNIGPYRGGRTKAVAGVPGQPYTFYIGAVGGGVWKTTDAGRTWAPIFDDEPTGSIGWVAVAPSDPNVLYVGSGEGLHRPDLSVGDGVYKSTDAGGTWTHLGLRDAQQIPKIVVDPTNPNRLFVAALGHPYGPNAERGIFRSTDGGQTFQKVLYKDENTGGKDVDIDPLHPNIVYASLWESRQGPWENAVWNGPGGGLFKSTDGGDTWTQLTEGLPPVASASVAIAPSNPNRLYAIVAADSSGARGPSTGSGQAGRGRGAGVGSGPAGRGGGGRSGAPIYRSDDGGATWTHITTDSRPASRTEEAEVVVDPKDPDTIIVTDVVTYKSTDGGKTYVPFKGAPGGDDYQDAWINPNDPNIILLASDQGAVVSLNGGASWSSWYNQPTAQVYHVMTDNAFPYRVCSGQQDSGSACVASRGNDGQITFRDWHPVGVEEYGYAAPDPLDPDLVYGGKVTRYDRRTGQVSSVGPLGGRGGGGPAGDSAAALGRTVRTQPVVFSQADKHLLFYGTNVLWRTTDGGVNWKQVSPDLTRKAHEVPPSVGKYTDEAKGQVDTNSARVIYTIGPSYVDPNRIWAGTDDGVIQTTADGGLHWTNVTPPAMQSYWKVFTIDPGRFDARTAYAAANTLRIDDMRPHLFRTHDAGRTWTEIDTGIPGDAAVSVIREDAKKKGLLFAGSETEVYVSFDDGDHWQSLRLNMPATSIRDLVVKDDDLVAGTHGRGFWILDDITPLRQIDSATADKEAVLYAPEAAYRVRWDMNTDTPLPIDEPRAPNPPDGAIIDYYLKGPASGPVTLEVYGSDGRLVRRYASTDPVPELPTPATSSLPLYWYGPPQSLSAAAGMHRFLWDVHYQPLGAGGGGRGGLPMAAVPHETTSAPSTPWVNPGTFIVKLTVDGHTYSQPLVVRTDPRVKTPALAMTQVYTLSKAAYYGAVDAQAAAEAAQRMRDQVAQLEPRATGAVAAALAAFDKQVAAVEGTAPAAGGAGRGGGGFGRGGRGGGAGAPVDSLYAASAGEAGVMNLLQAADVQPTANDVRAMTAAHAVTTRLLARWTAIGTIDLPALNAKLKAAGLPAIK